MVLDNGYIAEFDTPDVLLKSKSSIFHSMARDANLIWDNRRVLLQMISLY